MSRLSFRIAKITVLAAGWFVVVATSNRAVPVEYTDTEVQLSAGTAAPSTAIVDVRFEGAFLDQDNQLCAFVWADGNSAGTYRGENVVVEAIEIFGETSNTPSTSALRWVSRPLYGHDLGGCVAITCGRTEPCGGRFSVTLVDGSSPDAGLQPGPFDALAVAITAVTVADPGALPGRATVTVVETRP